MDFIYYDKVYSDIELEYYKQIIPLLSWDRQEEECIDRFISTTNEYPSPDKLLSAYMEFLNPIERDNLEKGFNDGFAIDAKFAKYKETDNFRWHCDDWIWRNEAPRLRRILSTITYLNDDYDGGETEFSNGRLIKPESGKTLIFPSFWSFPHRGLPVESGEKHILVMHIWT